MSDDVNVNNSALKNFVDNWYSANMVSYNDYIEDTIYCNDRTITDYGIFNPNGGYLGNDFVFLKFKNFVLNKDLSCTNVTDKFSMSNNKAKLTYPVGVVTASEVNLLNNDVARKQFGRMWTMTPGGISSNVAVVYIVNASGDIERIALNGEIDIKPVVSLKSGTKYISGDGSLDNPYVIKEIVYSDINVDNDNTKGTINIDDVSQIEEGTNVNFNILPKEGYLVSGISIKDSLNNDIDYTYSNSQYSFVMPNSNVTITSIYEKVKNSISVEIVNETENINIELSDLTEVEYGKEVVFKITPIKGYKVKSVIIKDENNNTINYIKRNNTYRLIMPAYDITIIPSYERVSNGVNVQDIEGTREFKIEINDASAVVYEDLVRFSIVPKKDYELQSINIIDENNNKIDYKKTDKEYEYEFVMPDTSVVITPIYKIIYRFIEGMEQVFNISKDTNLRFRSNMNYNDFINSGKIYIDKKEVDSKNYKLSEGSTIIVFSDEYSKKLSVGKHEIVTTLSDGSSCSTDFTITESLIDNPIIKKIGNPSTGDVVIILAVLLLFSGGFYRYLRIRKKDYYNKY